MGDLEKGDKGSQSSTADKVSRPVPKPRSNCLLGFCRLINFLTAICCLLCAVAHGMALMVGEGSVQGVQALTQQVLRLYGVGFAMILVCAELEWERFLVIFKVLDGFLGRGLLQAFEALLTLELTLQHGVKEGTTDFDKSLQLYRTVAGVSLLVCSAFYIIGGILCFGRIRKARYKREAERLRVQEDLAETERKRTELRGLLAMYSNE